MDFETGGFCPIQARQQTNPLERNPRRPTDRLCVFVFPLTLIVWLTIGISGFCTNQIHEGDGEDNSFNQIIMLINAPILRYYSLVKKYVHFFRPIGSAFILSLLISALSIFFYTLLDEKVTKIVIYIGFGFYFLSTIGWSIRAIIGTKNVMLATVYLSRILNNTSFWIFVTRSLIDMICTWLVAIYMVTSTFSFIKADKKVLLDITKDSCRVILSSPLVILFMELMIILASLVVSFTFNALLFDIFSERSQPLRYFYFIAILFGRLCALLSIFSFVVMVVSEYTINYYWKKDEKSTFLLGQSIVNTLGNHLGTIVFASTIFVSFICAIVQAFKHKLAWKHKENSIYYFVSKVYLALRMPDNTLIFASIYGTDFVKSSQIAFDVVLRQPSLFMAILGVYEGVFLLTPIFLLAVVLIIAIFTVAIDPGTEKGIINISLVTYGLVYSFISFVCLMFFTMKALLINKIIILNKDDQDTEGKAMILHQRI